MQRRTTVYAFLTLAVLLLMPILAHGQDIANIKGGPPAHAIENMNRGGPPQHVLDKFRERSNTDESVMEVLEQAYENSKMANGAIPLQAQLRQNWRKQVENNYSLVEIEEIEELSKHLLDQGYNVVPVTNIISYGKSMKFDVPPVIKDGRTLVPVRAMTAAYGFDVDYSPEQKRITLIRDNLEIVFILEDYEAIVNGEIIQLDVPPSAINGRSVLPLRFFIDQLGIDIKYNPEDGSIDIGADIEEMEDFYASLFDSIVDYINRKDAADYLTEAETQLIDDYILELIDIANDLHTAIEKELDVSLAELESLTDQIKEQLELLFDQEYSIIADIETLYEHLNQSIIDSIEQREAYAKLLSQDEIDEINSILDEMLAIASTLDSAIEENTAINTKYYQRLIEELNEQLEVIFENAEYLLIIEEIEDYLIELNLKISSILEEREDIEDKLTNEQRDELDDLIAALIKNAEIIEEAVLEKEPLGFEELKETIEDELIRVETVFDEALNKYQLTQMKQLYFDVVNKITLLNEQMYLVGDSLSQIDLFRVENYILEIADYANEIYDHIENENIIDLEEYELAIQEIVDEINKIFSKEI